MHIALGGVTRSYRKETARMKKMTRSVRGRIFLVASAVALSTVSLTACGGSATVGATW